METSRLSFKEITLRTSCWTTERPIYSYWNKQWGKKLISSSSTGSNISKIYATFAFVNHFNLADEVTWGLRNLSQGWQHKKLLNLFLPTVPCCTENGRARTLLWQAQRPFF
jgi:hypothetical protein